MVCGVFVCIYVCVCVCVVCFVSVYGYVVCMGMWCVWGGGNVLCVHKCVCGVSSLLTVAWLK